MTDKPEAASEIAEIRKRHERDKRKERNVDFPIWCDPECEGRCSVCPDDYRRELNTDRATLLSALSAKTAEAERLRAALVEIRDSKGGYRSLHAADIARRALEQSNDR